MNGWTGTTLRVDLGRGTITREPTNMKVAHDYIGARGMGVKIISDEVDPMPTLSALTTSSSLLPARSPGHSPPLPAATTWSPRAAERGHCRLQLRWRVRT